MNFALIIKALVGIASLLYGSLLLHDVAHEMDKEELAKHVLILKTIYK